MQSWTASRSGDTPDTTPDTAPGTTGTIPQVHPASSTEAPEAGTADPPSGAHRRVPTRTGLLARKGSRGPRPKRRSLSRSRRLLVAVSLLSGMVLMGWLISPIGPAGSSGAGDDAVSMLTEIAPVTWSGAHRGSRSHYRSPSAGVITGVRFKAVPGGPTRYLASLWSGRDVLDAWGVTGPASPDGWMTAPFASPVHTDAGTSYTVRYWASPRGAGRVARGEEVSVLFTPASAAPAPAPAVPSQEPTPSAAPRPTASAGSPVTTPSAKPAPGADCSARPSSCGYPDETTTGVPDGVKLRRSSSVKASRDGQVINGLDITGEINVTAKNVVIRNTRVTGGGDWVVIVRPGADNLTIEDSELMTPAGTPQDIACVLNVGDSKPKILRVNIHGCSAGVSSGGGLVKDSYIHDMAQKPGLSHDVGVASNGGGGMSIIHNTIFNQLDQTAAIAFYQDFGTQKDNLVENNLLAGGGYCIYGGTGTKGGTSNIRFVNNRFSTKYHSRCGYYGTVASFDLHDPGNRWSGNVWDGSLLQVAAS